MRNDFDGRPPSEASTETDAFYGTDHGAVISLGGGLQFDSSYSKMDAGSTMTLQPSIADPLGANRLPGISAPSDNVSTTGNMGTRGPAPLPAGFGNVSTGGEVSGTMQTAPSAVKASGGPSHVCPRGSMEAAPLSGSSSARFVAQLQQLQASGLALKRSIESKTKPWPDFLRFSSFDRPPPTAALVADRIDRNLRYFLFNYMTIASAIAVACLLTNPFTLCVLCMFGCLALYVSTQGENVQISSTTQLPAKQAQLCIAVCAGFCLMLFSAQVLFAAAGCGLVIILIHACLHCGKSYEEIQAEAVQDGFA